jgi:Tfp pilus assembly protein PilF
MRQLTPSSACPEPYEVTHALERIRAQSRITPAELRLLTYVVEQTLAGQAEALNQKTIAADVFGRNLVEFNPKADSIVRTTFANLRASLMLYYAGSGQGEAVQIELPKGSYAPEFAYRESLSPASNSHLWSARVALESRSASGFRTAITHLDRVLQEAPRLSIALALKAEALAGSAAHGSPPLPALEQSRTLARLALEREAPAWQAWVAMGAVHSALEWDWPKAAQCFETALQQSNGESATHVWYTAYLVARGRAREAVSHLRRAVSQYGYFNPTHLADLGMIQMLARDYDDAEVTINSALEAAPEYYQHHLNKALLLEARGDAAGALQVLDRTPLRIMERPVTWGLRALFAGLSGDTATARRRMLWLRTVKRAGQHVPSSQFAACALGLGNPLQAIQYFADGAAERDPLAIWFHAYPLIRHLDEYPAYQQLIDSMGLIRSAARP